MKSAFLIITVLIYSACNFPKKKITDALQSDKEFLEKPFTLNKRNVTVPIQSNILYHRNDYDMLYSEKYEQAIYVKYTINKVDINGLYKRKNNFKEDIEIENKSASLKDYRKSGYDRGHLKPAAVSKGSKLDMDQSFLMSNMSPQLPEFNRQGWKNIESKVRKLLNSQDSVIVYTGPVLNDVDSFIGINKVGIPKFYFKAILLGDSSLAFAYLVPHCKLSKPYERYVITINELEERINIDLYPGLSENIESLTE
jgi:endonuclease G